MQAMKLEKDNAMDRADACEQQAKDAHLRAEKAEEEVRDLQKKMQQLERYGIQCCQNMKRRQIWQHLSKFLLMLAMTCKYQ